VGQVDQITLLIKAEVDRAIKEMNSFNSTLDKTQKETSKTSKVFGSARSVMMGLAAAAGTMYVAYKALIEPASNLEEAHNKFSVVFRDNIEQAEEWANVLVESYAMSTREAYQYLSAVQDLLKPMGIAPQMAAEMSNEVVKLAADLSSFNNVPTSQVIQDINSALVGNFETMKKYGVVLNETTLRQKAMAMGLWDGKGVLDAATKAQVAFKLSLEGSADAQGDMLRTSDSWANIQKKISARLENMGATLGKDLLPAMKQLGNLFLEVTEDGGVLMETLKSIIKLVGYTSSGINKLFVMSELSSVNAPLEGLQNRIAKIGEETKKTRAEANQALAAYGGYAAALKSGNQDAVSAAEPYRKKLEQLRNEYVKTNTYIEQKSSRQQELWKKADVLQDSEINKVKSLTEARRIEKAQFEANEDAKTEKTLSASQIRLQARQTAEQAYKDFIKGSQAQTIADLAVHYETLLEMDGVTNEMRLELYAAYLEQKKEMEMQSAQDAMQVMQTASQGIQTILNLENKRRNIILDKQYKKEKAAILANVKDEEERKKALEALDAKYEAKRTALRKEQAKQEKAMALMNAIINTAAGITAALTMPPPMSFIMAAITGAMGAAQIGLIAATPIPAAEGALIKGSREGTLMQAGENNATEAIIPLENDEAMERLSPIMGGGGTVINLNIDNLYAAEDVPEKMAMAIDKALLDLRQNNNSAFSRAVEGR